MPYLPLARKYRPKTFEELVGQSHITATLTRALETKRLAQAYLFTGQRGVGKTSAARILAKCLNCERGPTATPCDACASCTQITQGNSLDVIEIDGASNRGIDEIRSLRETVPYAPTSGQFRVYIIDEVHQITPDAFNALLKTLEEPPAHVKFIFATTVVSKVPATILSRCQRFDFRRIEPATIVEVLGRVANAERITAEAPALFAIARAADGSLRDAEVIFEQLANFVARGAITEAAVTELLGVIEADALLALTQAILQRSAPAALAILTEQLEQGKDPLQLLTGLLHHVRNLMILRTTREAASREATLARLVDEPAERLARLEEQANLATPQELLLMLQVLTGAYELVRRSPMAQTIVELTLIKLATREQWQSLEQISRRLEQLGSSSPGAPSVGAAVLPAPSPKQAPAAHMTAADEPSQLMRSGAPESSEELAGVWGAFLERIKAQKMSLAAYLADASPVGWEGEVLTVGISAFALHQEVLNVTDNVRLIERLLSEVCQRPVKIRYAILAAPVVAPKARDANMIPASAPPIVQDIVNLFNATVLEQPPKPA